MKNSILGLSGVTLLSNEEQREIKGGGTCGYMDKDGYVLCGLSKKEALFMFDGRGDGSNWCCDSCGDGGSASYC